MPADEAIPAHIQAFYKASTYPHPVNNISMIQTHASWVFLTGEFAYKFKKPIDFGFMDFSTLAKRKYYCDRELILNRTFSAQLYLEVLPVHQIGTTFNLNGAGKLVDYCLKMVQFKQSDLLDKKLAALAFQPQWMDQLAEDVAGFHHQAEIYPTDMSPADASPIYAASTDTFDHVSCLADHLRDNLAIASQYPELGIDGQTLDTLLGFSNTERVKQQQTLIHRQLDRHIRRCHGDLHFRNITLWQGRPCLFDCIEFNDQYSIIDSMNDIAFLLMDCDAHARPDLGMRFLSRYLECSNDYAGLSLLPLYLFYRAGVRGKVNCILANELADPAQRQAQWAQARHYFELAERYTHHPTPALFAMGGLSGSGKSHLSLLGCGIESAIIIRSDAVRKRIASHYPDLELYGSEMHGHTYQAMFDAAQITLQAGYSVILDATFLHPDSRQQAHDLAHRCKVALHFYWLDIDTAQLQENIRHRQERGHDISDADLNVLALQLKEYQRPSESWIHWLDANDCWPRVNKVT
ncbi:MAG: AAA family ATPase [Mariprofundus sp.]|nr:AAA family ATPase [Mariprofundus sp.]